MSDLVHTDRHSRTNNARRSALLHAPSCYNLSSPRQRQALFSMKRYFQSSDQLSHFIVTDDQLEPSRKGRVRLSQLWLLDTFQA